MGFWKLAIFLYSDFGLYISCLWILCKLRSWLKFVLLWKYTLTKTASLHFQIFLALENRQWAISSTLPSFSGQEVMKLDFKDDSLPLRPSEWFMNIFVWEDYLFKNDEVIKNLRNEFCKFVRWLWSLVYFL